MPFHRRLTNNVRDRRTWTVGHDDLLICEIAVMTSGYGKNDIMQNAIIFEIKKIEMNRFYRIFLPVLHKTIQ